MHGSCSTDSSSDALPLVIISALCGIAVLVLLHRGARRGARPLAVGAVAAVVWGWGIAQHPYLLPETLKISDGAAPSATLTALLVIFGVAVVLVLPVDRAAVHARPAQRRRGDLAALAASDAREGLACPRRLPHAAGSSSAPLIAVAAVANLGLAVANVALPSIGKHFDASQTELNLVAVGYSLGLAASVLYFGAVGDRYGRKLLLILGMVLTVPADCLAAWAPSIDVLFAARVIGGLAAGMAYPTTLALITALWSGSARTKSIALWAAIGGGISALGPLCSGILLEHYWWGSVFLLTLPLAVIALAMALVLVPNHVNESTDPVDHLGGVLSIAFVGALSWGSTSRLCRTRPR